MFSFNKMFDHNALFTEFDIWSYKKLSDISNKIVHSINKRSLVFLLCTNTPESIAGYVGCLNHGIVPVMLDAEMGSEFLIRLTDLYRPFCFWLPRKRAEDFPAYEKIFSLDGYVLLATSEENPFPLHEELALLMSTSGSTGSPKLVRLSYENIRANKDSIIKYLGIDEHERSITNLPMHYVYGLSIINTHLAVGASLVVTDKTMFQKEFWQLFKEKRVTNFGGVPYTFEMLHRLRFSRMEMPQLRTITQAGGKLDVELHREFADYAERQGKNFVVMYGAAEATARMGYLPPKESLRKCGSMGIAIPGGRFELLDEEGNVIERADTQGELVYHGPNVMMGYAECGEDLARGDEMQGTLRTGDLAERDDDGFYRIVGRKKQFLKMFGKRTNLEEVEHLLRQHFAVTEVACGGVDDRMYAFLTEDPIAGDVISYLSATLGLHPSAFCVKCLAAIPRNSSGKTLYRELEQYYGL